MKKIWSVAILLMLSACVGTSQQSRFYSMRPVSRNEVSALSQAKMNIGIEEVKIPDYLDKPQIVTMKDNSVELNISEVNRWSEALSTMMQRTIANDMGAYLPNSVVKARNLSRETFGYVIFVEIDRFDGQLDQGAHLDAWWYAINKEGKIVIRERVVLEQKTGNSYDDLVMAESKLVAELSKQIAQKISQRGH